MLIIGLAGKTLDDWLRDGFFEQHCELFHQRPFVWHIWDGRRDGFHALAQKGDKVCCGQKLLKFSRQKIEDAGYSPVIGFTVSNSDEMEAVTFDSTGFTAIGDAIGQYVVAAKQG